MSGIKRYFHDEICDMLDAGDSFDMDAYLNDYYKSENLFEDTNEEKGNDQEI